MNFSLERQFESLSLRDLSKGKNFKSRVLDKSTGREILRSNNKKHVKFNV